MAQNKEYAIETIGLSKAFKDWWGRTKVLAVDDLELKINYNEVYGLLGPNGSGKSTTIKMLLSLLRPTKGVSFVLGGRSDDPKISTRIGFLPEESYLYKYLSARETLKFYGDLFGLPSKVLNMRIDSLLDMVGLSSMANRPVGTFSKGMARRIGLAQALINDPDLLILDEPTSGLDPIGTRQIKDLIASLAKRGKTILMCSHLLSDVEDVCDRIGILYGGKMQTEGYVSDLLRRNDEQQITTSPLSESAISQIREIVEKEKASISIGSPMDSLENLFMRIVEKAQMQNQETSGAVSTTNIGNFLSDDNSQDVLDRLVSADIKPIQDDSFSSEVEKVEPLETPDNSLLNQLSSKSVSIEPVTEITEAPDKNDTQESSSENDKVDTDLLKNLMKGPDEPEGESKELDNG